MDVLDQVSFNDHLLLRCNKCLLVLKLVRVSLWGNYVCIYKFTVFFYSWRFCCSSGGLSARNDLMTGYGEICYRALYLQYQRQKVEEVSDERVRFEMSTMGGIHVCTNCRLFIIILSYEQGYFKNKNACFCLSRSMFEILTRLKNCYLNRPHCAMFTSFPVYQLQTSSSLVLKMCSAYM